jgi:hypothetical protein
MLRMGRWPCCYLFCQWKLPIRLLCITMTKSLLNYRTYKITYHWCSVDAHAKNWAVTVLLSLLPIKAANSPLCITTTKSLVNYRTYKTTNCWRSVNAHAKNVAVTVLLSVSNGSGLPGCGPGLEPDWMVQFWSLPGNQGYPPGSGTGWNRTAVLFYSPYNFGLN